MISIFLFIKKNFLYIDDITRLDNEQKEEMNIILGKIKRLIITLDHISRCSMRFSTDLKELAQDHPKEVLLLQA